MILFTKLELYCYEQEVHALNMIVHYWTNACNDDYIC